MLPRFTADTTPESRGILHAVVEGVQVRRLSSDTYLAQSISSPGTWHVVRAHTCDCEAGQAGRYCKHLAAVEMAEQDYAAESRQCLHCGHAGPDVSPHLEHVGGIGYLELDRCDNIAECWQRWDAQHSAVGVAR